MHKAPPPGNPYPQHPFQPGGPYHPHEVHQTQLLTQHLNPREESEILAEKSRRNSKMTAIGVAILIHGLILGALTLIIIHQFEKETPIIVAVDSPDIHDPNVDKPLVQSPRRTPTAKPSQITKVLAADAQSPHFAPVVEDIIDDPVDLSAGIGNEMGVNPFDGSFTSFLPQSMSKRCSHKDREERLAESGGKPESQEAVLKALKWLQTQQKEDGSWGEGHKASMTGLALLAYLGHCETPDSKEFGDTVLDAILYLVEMAVKNDGKLSLLTNNHWVYEHGIATYALAEAYSITKYGKKRIPRIREALELSVPLIVQGQQENGGWDYMFRQGERSDMSVAGWQIQALKAVQHSKLPISGVNEAMDRAMEFCKHMQGPKGAFGYTRPEEERYTLAGAGALCLAIGTGKPNSKEVRDAVDFILDDRDVKFGVKGDKGSVVYAWYYNTQACFQRGGSSWTRWNRMFQDEVLKAQEENGSWATDGGDGPASSSPAGADARVYTTCLLTLMLEVYYRYLPATETPAPTSSDALQLE